MLWDTRPTSSPLSLGPFTFKLGGQGRQPAASTPPLAHVAVEAPLQPPSSRRAGGQVSKAELGRSTWMLLHTLASEYPEKPSRKERRALSQLLGSLGVLYPCATCATGWATIMKEEKPVVSSRVEFNRWLCRAHNAVNRKLGKPEMDCQNPPMWMLECDEEDGACKRPTTK